MDVSRTTRTNLDVMQERRIDDHWNIDGSRDLAVSWKGFTQFTLVEEKPPDGYMWSPGGDWQNGKRHPGPNYELREKQKCSNEKPKLGDAGRLRGTYCMDPEDKEFKETIKNARRKLETPMAPAVPCKTSKKNKYGETRGKTNEIKSKFACILEASESTRLRMEESLPNYDEDHIAGKGDDSLQHYNLVHKFIPIPQAMKIPAAKAAVDKEWEKLEKITAWNIIRGDRWNKDERRESSFCFTDGHLSFEECRIGDKAPKMQRTSCTSRRHYERWSWILCSVKTTTHTSIVAVWSSTRNSRTGQKMNKFSALTTSEFGTQSDKPNKVWSDLKHLGICERSFWCQCMRHHASNLLCR